MARIYNSELSKELVEGARLQQSADKIPQELAEKVVPVMEVNPKILKKATLIGSLSRNATTAGVAIYTTLAGKETYLTGLNFSNTQDAVSDNVLMSVVATIDGRALQPIYKRVKQTTTAGSFFDSVVFNPAIKIDEGTAISLICAFTAGTSVSEVSLFGYFVDNPLA